MRKANSDIKNLCPNDEHDIRKSASHCGACGADLCELCGTDAHFTSDGHDLSHPAYWGV
jgi:hypothetical protein